MLYTTPAWEIMHLLASTYSYISKEFLRGYIYQNNGRIYNLDRQLHSDCYENKKTIKIL